MSRRRVQVVLICEDRQQGSFAQRFLGKQSDFDVRNLRVEMAPKGGGAGEQNVRKTFVKELQALHSFGSHVNSCLIVMADADPRASAPDRIRGFELACGEAKVEFRRENEKVAFIIPKRNIETWLHFLEGKDVNEDDEYQKLKYQSECRPLVDRLVEACRRRKWDRRPPLSLEFACEEYNTRLNLRVSS
ncbi:MAG: hypothetical protein NTX50_06285 [Candidatus Sumerlaeota bacterium]|nr:hypothetical protein [Candidatus Sumerlaeota bacterium]